MENEGKFNNNKQLERILVISKLTGNHSALKFTLKS